jgi:cytochrome c oxidase accessory protein FixG
MNEAQAPVDGALYAARQKIYPREIKGRFQRLRVYAVFALLGLYYVLPWIRWGERQAVLFDLPARKFHIFGLTLWPQDFYFLTWLLIIAALALFFFTALAGRLFCGYACPQTVWTETFVWIERWVEGSRTQQMKLARAPLSGEKILRKGTKYFLWFAFALWTGFTFVGYFTPITELAGKIASFSTGPWETFWVLFYGGATYVNAGFMREQVCKYMCPYARFQSAMFDPDTLIVSYDHVRGEPRGPGSKNSTRTEQGLGDCVACGLCVQVCPTGIDIRNGLQYECISCGMCIDACNYVMDKVGLPQGLIRYSSEHAIKERFEAAGIWRHVMRPRVMIYAGILATVTIALVVALLMRVPLKVDVIRDRGALAREAEDGRVENTYRLQVMNTTERARKYVVSASGLQGIELATEKEFEVPGASTRPVLVRLRAAQESVAPGSNKVKIGVQAVDDPSVQVSEPTVFIGLRR